MSSKVQFSDVHGENIEISGDKLSAIWIPKASDGWACSETEFNPGEVIELKIEGNGRCDIGFMKDEQSQRCFKTLHEIRSHRRLCCIEVSYKESGDEISSKFGEKVSTKKLRKETNLWVAIFIRYGDMSVEILTKDQPQKNKKFSSSKHGSNIRLENDSTFAASVCKNPASICFISEQLEVGQIFNLHCAPENEGNRQPLRYELKIYVYDKDPLHLTKDFKHLFHAAESRRNDHPLTTIETFEKDECHGIITIKMSDSKTVQYKTARGKQNTQTLNIDSKNGVWIVLDLYRVKVKLENCQTMMPEEDAAPSNAISIPIDQLDSLSHPLSNPSEVQTESGTESQTEGGNENVVRYLAGRVNNLEQELQNMKVRTRISASSMPRPMSCPDMNILTNDLGDELNIQKRFPDLVRSIDTLTFCDHLFAKGVVTDVQMDAIHAIFNQRGSPEANRELLKVMKTKRIDKSMMIEIVEETQQQHLLEMFYPPTNSFTRR